MNANSVFSIPNMVCTDKKGQSLTLFECPFYVLLSLFAFVCFFICKN